MAFSRLLAWAGALALGVALTATGGCTTVVAQEPGGGGGDAASGTDGSSSSSSGGGSSSGSSGGAADAGACLPGDVTTYAPQYHPAGGAHQGACTDTELHGFFDACLRAGASADGCNKFTQNSPKCVACILTPDSDMKYGPLVGHGSFVTANVAGCIELTDWTSSALACAKAVQAQGGCELLACEANCNVHDSSSLDAYDTCAATADQAGCSTYASASACIQGLQEAGDGVAQCLTQDFATFYDAVAPLFCGVAPATDAGAPPYDAGPPPPDGSTAGD